MIQSVVQVRADIILQSLNDGICFTFIKAFVDVISQNHIVTHFLPYETKIVVILRLPLSEKVSASIYIIARLMPGFGVIIKVYRL